MWNRNLRIGLHRDGRLIVAACLATFLGFVAYVSRLSDVTHDAFHEMALVRAMFESGSFPLNDIFAFTPTVSPAVHHEWGTGLFLYMVAGANPMGLHGMAVARLLLITLLGLTIYRVARNNGAHPLLIALCVPIAFPLAWVGFATLRAQLLTLVFMAVQALLQQTDWRGRKHWVVSWFVLYVVWLNAHAGFVVGIAMLGLHVLERWIVAIHELGSVRWRAEFASRFWHHFALLPLLAIGVCMNPWGMSYPAYLFHAIRMPRPTILEWQPLWMTPDATTTMVAFAGMVLSLGYVAKNRHWTRLRGWIFCCLAAYMALKHIRHGSLFAICWMSMLPGWLTPTPIGRALISWINQNRIPLIATAWVMCTAFFSFAVRQQVWLASLPSDEPNGLMVYPAGAVSYLKENEFRGKLVTPFAAGAYVSWNCYPNILVSLDGRYEVAYQPEVLPKHDQFYSASPGWQSFLAEFPADGILVQQNAPVRQLLGKKETNSDHYHLVYEDRAFAVFVHDSLSVRASESVGSSQRR